MKIKYVNEGKVHFYTYESNTPELVINATKESRKIFVGHKAYSFVEMHFILPESGKGDPDLVILLKDFKPSESLLESLEQ